MSIISWILALGLGLVLPRFQGHECQRVLARAQSQADAPQDLSSPRRHHALVAEGRLRAGDDRLVIRVRAWTDKRDGDREFIRNADKHLTARRGEREEIGPASPFGGPAAGAGMERLDREAAAEHPA